MNGHTENEHHHNHDHDHEHGHNHDHQKDHDGHGQGPKYFVNIEGQEYPWHQNTITTEQIAELGGWDISQGVIEVDEDNNEHTLNPGQVIEIKPGHGFGKKHRWKRGLMRERIVLELDILRKNWGDVQHIHSAGEDWFLISEYPVPSGWRIGDQAVEKLPVVFLISAAYPGAAPYAFIVPTGVNFNGNAPLKTGAPQKAPPFEGDWLQFSWQPEDWAATNEIHKGSNLLSWSRSFGNRFREGV
jgi:hypothetical protein